MSTGSEKAGGGPARWRSLRLGVVLIATAVLLFAGYLFVDNTLRSEFPWVNHDVAFFTYLGLDILGGAQLYVDVYELNPPGAHFLHAGIIAAADTLGISELLLTHLLVLTLSAAGIGLLLDAYREPRDDATFALVTLAYLLVPLRGNFANNILPEAPWFPYDFAQREHMFSVLWAPYLIWSLAGRRAAPAVWAYAVILGYVSVFKPYWPVMLLAVELYVILRHGRRPWGFYACMIGGMFLPYAILLVQSPKGFAVLFTELLPEVLGGLYRPYEMAYADFAGTALSVQMLSAGVLFLLCWIGAGAGRFVDRGTLTVALFVTGWAYGSVLHQHKFWSYQGMVYFATVVVLGAHLLALNIRHHLDGRTRAAGVVIVGAIFLMVGVSSLWNLERMLDQSPPKGRELVALLREEPNVMVLSTSADYAYAPLYLRVTTVGPWREHFGLPALLGIEDPRARREALEGYARKVAARIDAAKPQLLLFPPYANIHDILVRFGAVPLEDYDRAPDGWLWSREPELRGWIAYRRASSPASTSP